MRRVFAALGAAVLVLGLGACGAPEGDAGTRVDTGFTGDLRAFNVALEDGRTVVCVVYAAGSGKAGLSCDWEGAK